MFVVFFIFIQLFFIYRPMRARCKSRSMQATFFFTFILPPPPAGAKILPLAHCPRAGSATDTGKSLVMQWVIWYLVLFYIVPNLVFRPMEDGMELNQVVAPIPFNLRHILPVIGL